MTDEKTPLQVRAWHSFCEEVQTTETGERDDRGVLHKVALAAVLKNPHAGTFTEDLSETVAAGAWLGEQFAERITRIVPGVELNSYGKAAVVGANGSYEHGNALLTTEWATPVRQALGGAISWMPSTGKIGGPGTSIDIPLGHKMALYVRSYYDTVSIMIPDGPRPDELVIVLAAASRTRIRARLGGPDESQIDGTNGLT